MFVRVPSCYQSFWVDELHSAWCVWDAFGDVAPRARLGNQSSGYFAGLWCWKQVFGDSELALRMSSVLMTSVAAATMTAGVSRLTTSTIAGTASGLVLALESNAIFFGTELRPYAAVILCSSVATLCFLRLMKDRESATAGATLVISTLIASVVQPTAVGVLSLLFVALAVQRVTQQQFTPRPSLLNVLLAAVVIMAGWWLWETTLAASWASRRAWASFATAPSLWQAIGIWDWLWLWVLPLVVILFKRPLQKNAIVIAIIIVVAAVAFWAASRMDWVHLWHRRYLVALLPMFALLVGLSLGRFKTTKDRSRWLQIAGAVLLIVGMTSFQGVAPVLFRAPHRLAHRGEDWRSAVGWVQSERNPNDSVWLDPGLIESRILTQWRTIDPPPTMEDLTYLRYPVSGPYRISDVRLIPPIGANDQTRANITGRVVFDVKTPLWVIARASPVAANRFALRISRGRLPAKFSALQMKSFGGVSVIRFSKDDEELDL